MIQTTPISDLVTVSVAAGRDASTIARYLRSGRLAGSRPGREWLIPRAEIDAFRSENRFPLRGNPEFRKKVGDVSVGGD
jgi:excisionase family DNA binding protein